MLIFRIKRVRPVFTQGIGIPFCRIGLSVLRDSYSLAPIVCVNNYKAKSEDQIIKFTHVLIQFLGCMVNLRYLDLQTRKGKFSNYKPCKLSRDKGMTYSAFSHSIKHN